jgi:hypothetical protein
LKRSLFESLSDSPSFAVASHAASPPAGINFE